MIPVWFFVGVILLIYGIIIFCTGIYEFSSPPPTVLANTHPAIWWGALLTVIGGIYVYAYMPKKILRVGRKAAVKAWMQAAASAVPKPSRLPSNDGFPTS